MGLYKQAQTAEAVESRFGIWHRIWGSCEGNEPPEGAVTFMAFCVEPEERDMGEKTRQYQKERDFMKENNIQQILEHLRLLRFTGTLRRLLIRHLYDL